jgi:hypothetical protein
MMTSAHTPAGTLQAAPPAPGSAAPLLEFRHGQTFRVAQGLVSIIHVRTEGEPKVFYSINRTGTYSKGLTDFAAFVNPPTA